VAGASWMPPADDGSGGPPTPTPTPTSTPTAVEAGIPARGRPTPLLVAGIASLGNGIALLGNIFLGLPLPALLATTWTTAVVALLVIGGLGRPAARARLRAHILVGIGAGLIAVASYDVTKAVLSQLDPSPFNPFEVTKVFGRLLLGGGASSEAIVAAGWAFHLVNGVTFAIAYALLLARDGDVSRRRGLVTGIAWGLFLESFQLAIYPGWLNIGFVDEFRQISFLSHVVFGAVLGLLVPSGLRYMRRRVVQRTGRTA
jgi:hypothetical protein